jgi:hypothetical protein
MEEPRGVRGSPTVRDHGGTRHLGPRTEFRAEQPGDRLSAVFSIALPTLFGRCGSGPSRTFIFASSALVSRWLGSPWAHHRGGQFNTRANWLGSPRHNMRPSRQIFPYCAKPRAAVLLNQSRAPLPSNMAVWDGAVLGGRQPVPVEKLATDISNDEDRVRTGAPAHQPK